MKYLLLTIVLVLIVGGLLYYRYGGYSKNNTSTVNTNNPNAVTISNFAFSPSEIKVAPGTEVTFINNDSVAHTITADNGAFDSGKIGTEQSYKHVFDTAGTFSYHCTIHPEMKGTVIVK